jgi:glycerol uptake facilitator-like aquaporin
VTLSRQLAAEGLGTALLLAVVIGSGIMGERLAAGNTGIALLANSIATGCALYALILVFAPVSGAHFNPAVTLVAMLNRQITKQTALAYVGVQLLGAFTGVAAAHAMFEVPLFFASQHERTGGAQWWAECVATFGLLVVILGSARQSLPAIAAAVGAYITAAYWFTASTSFANPAVTLARAASDTFAGIRPTDAPGFVLAQLTGAFAAAAVLRWFNLPNGKPER